MRPNSHFASFSCHCGELNTSSTYFLQQRRVVSIITSWTVLEEPGICRTEIDNNTNTVELILTRWEGLTWNARAFRFSSFLWPPATILPPNIIKSRSDWVRDLTGHYGEARSWVPTPRVSYAIFGRKGSPFVYLLLTNSHTYYCSSELSV